LTPRDPLVAKAVRAALADFEYFCRRFFFIRRKDGTVGTLELNSIQRKIVAAINKQVAGKRSVRLVVLKARQMGVSTVIQAYILWRMLRDGNLSAMEIAHEREAARHILDINRFAVRSLPEWFRAAVGIKETYFTKYEMAFANGSSLVISSAESSNPGRSRTLHLVHLSECAFYEDAGSLTRALFAAVPDFNNTAVFVESTGDGPAGWFHDTFQRAKRGLSEYEALFFPWYEHEEYRRPVPPGVEVRRPPELSGVPLTVEQLYWRQWKVENDFGGDEEKFRREFPATEEEAFISGSATLFDYSLIGARLREVEALVPWQGFLVVQGSRVEFQHAPGERLRVFKPPVPGRQYVVGVDVGSGAAIEGDFSVATVLDAATGEQVAIMAANRMEPLQFAYEVKLLGTWYNMALVAPEVTDGHGLSVANWLRDEGYYMLYRRRVFDKVTSDWTHKLGWRTDRRTKGLIIDALRADFANGAVVLNDAETLKEMRVFIRHDDGQLGAAAGAHDDRVMALAIANQVRREVAEQLASPQQAAVPQAQVPVQQEGLLRRPIRKAPVRQFDELGAYA
jgi:hypothetical protein